MSEPGVRPTVPARDRRNVAVLAAAQALLGSQLPMVFVIGGLVGQQMAPTPCLATLPITMIVLGSATTAPWLSVMMQARGRRAGFLTGAVGGAAGAVLAALAVSLASFPLFLAASYLTGIYMSAQGFYRFAASDVRSDAFRPRAISYVLSGGLAAALIGPQVVTLLTAQSPVATAERYVPVYLAAALVNLAGMTLFLALDSPRPAPQAAGSAAPRTRREILATPGIAVAMLCAAMSFALMNLVMTSAPLAVVGCGFAVSDAANVVSAHVFAMYLPSFFTGHLIGRFGSRAIVSAGLAILMGAGLVALAGVELTRFFGAMILLGLGWNFGFIGATAMLTEQHGPGERGRVQGMNDMFVFGAVLVASVASGGLMNCTGGDPAAGWAAVNVATIPLICLAGAALIWLRLRAPDPS